MSHFTEITNAAFVRAAGKTIIWCCGTRIQRGLEGTNDPDDVQRFTIKPLADWIYVSRGGDFSPPTPVIIIATMTSRFSVNWLLLLLFKSRPERPF